MRSLLTSIVLSSAALMGSANATTVALPTTGAWNAFSVDSLLADPATPLGWIDDAGASLSFSFTIGAGFVGTLTVVDAGFAGDAFAVTNAGAPFGNTSAVPPGTFEAAHDIGLDFDGALADPLFSRGVFVLGPGSYLISGSLLQSVTLGGDPLDATAGGIRVRVAAIPEPTTLALLLAGFGGIAARIYRRTA